MSWFLLICRQSYVSMSSTLVNDFFFFNLLLRQTSDIGIAPLTITSSRSHVIDFSAPFMEFGLQMLILKSSELPTDFWKFLKPLHWSVWFLLIVAVFVHSVNLAIVNQYSPYSYRNARRLRGEPRLKKTDCAIDEFSLYNSLWFMAASFTQQGSDKQPLAPSGRIMGIIWYLFSLLMINMYIANLAAVFTNTTARTKIVDVAGLPFQDEFVYGTVTGSQAHEFFNSTTIPTYQRVWNGMKANSGASMVASSAAGVKKAKESRYAFIWESASVHYVAQRKPCTLSVVGNPFDLKSYGFGLPLNAAWTDDFSRAVLRLREDGTVAKLHHKWWDDRTECASTSATESLASGQTVTLAQIAGVLFIFTGAVGVAFFTLVIEVVIYARELSMDEKVWHICNKSLLKCETRSQPVTGQRKREKN